MKSNDLEIENSLKAMQTVFSDIQNYRVVGSLLVASINGQPHRELHDIDLLLDEKDYPKIKQRFQKQGFTCTPKHALGFKWDEFGKPDHLTFGTLLIGQFQADYFVYQANRWLRLKIKNQYLSPTNYRLFDLPIRGIPLRSVYEGIKVANLNTKRKIDKEIVKKAVNDKTSDGLSINQAFRVEVFSVPIPYLYIVFSQAYNLIGGFRLKLGKSYDPWT